MSLAGIRNRSRGQRGQTLPIFALMAVILFGVAALAVDVGLNFRDQRMITRAADMGALAGSETYGAAFVNGSGSQAVLNQAEHYTWQNLGAAPGTFDCTQAPWLVSATTCVVGPINGYTVTATFPYTQRNSGVNVVKFPTGQNVAIDITHVVPQIGFAGVLGVSSVTITAHAAANSPTSQFSYPYALATRLLEITGSGSVSSYGSAIVGQCSAQGTGGFAVGGASSINGGFYTNGGAQMILGRASSGTSGGGVVYDSAQALLLSDAYSKGSGSGSLVSCNGTPSNDSQSVNSWPAGKLHDSVCFDASAPCADTFNTAFGFDAGQGSGANCAQNTDANTCSPYGDTGWMDPSCWSDKNGTVPIGTMDATFTGSATSFGSVSGSTATNPGSCASGAGANPTNEGSYLDANSIGFPGFGTPASVAAALEGVSIPAIGTTGAAIPAGSGSPITPGAAGGRVFSSGSATTGNFIFQPGYYIFEGKNASVSLGGGDSFQCETGPPQGGLSGCVFIFRDGAELELSKGGGSTLSCDPSVSIKGVTGAQCSFEFDDRPKITSATLCGGTTCDGSTFTAHNNTTGSVFPVLYPTLNQSPAITLADCTASPPSPLPSWYPCPHMPVIWTDSQDNCLSGSAPSYSAARCAVDIQGSGTTLEMGGTVYAPFGIVSITSNAHPVSGQLIADTVHLQAGSNGLAGVAYNSALTARVAGTPILFE
ncbi:MAG: TadE/TadG family type IV pilus assembly protein [Candidatus Dormibacteria bacterium]